MSKNYYVYIITNKRYGTLYTGVTSNLVQRIFQHRNGFVDGFAKREDLHRLVWYEVHEDVIAAIEREKRIKKWRRDWKINLIQGMNPDWNDSYERIV